MIKVECEEYNHFNQECSTDSKLMERRRKKGEKERGKGKKRKKREEREERKRGQYTLILIKTICFLLKQGM